MAIAYIYGLLDPRIEEEMRYIGWTVDPCRRLRGHIGEARRGHDGYRNNWIRTLLRIGLEPRMVILEEGPYDHNQAERDWIHLARALGHRITNMTDGGTGAAPGNKNLLGHKHSLKTREQISAQLKGKPKSLKHRANMKSPKSPEHRASLSALWDDPDFRARNITKRVGAVRTKETRDKISAGRKDKGLGRTPWNKGKQGLQTNPYKGLKRNPEVSVKISAATKIAMTTPEVRARFLEGIAQRNYVGEKNPFYGKRHKAASLAKLSASKKGQKLPRFCCVSCQRELPVNWLSRHLRTCQQSLIQSD